MTLSFRRNLTFGTLSGRPGDFMIVLRDDGDVQDADATVALARRPVGDIGPASPRVEVLLGAARARILQAVGKPMTMGALASALNYAPSTISYHAGILSSADLLVLRHEGGYIWASRSFRGEMLIETLL